MVFAEPGPDSSNTAHLYFLTPDCLRNFVALTDGASLPLKKSFIPFIVEQAANAESGFVYVTFQMKSHDDNSSVALRERASEKIQAMSDDVFSIHFFTEEFGYTCLGSKIAASNFSVDLKIPLNR